MSRFRCGTIFLEYDGFDWGAQAEFGKVGAGDFAVTGVDGAFPGGTTALRLDWVWDLSWGSAQKQRNPKPRRRNGVAVL
jgi:hypothetical protein